MNTINVPINVIENICKYCEDMQVYDKLGRYGDFYYKLKCLLNKEFEENLTTEDIIERLSIDSKYYECNGCEFTDLDADFVRQLVKNGYDYDVAIDMTLRGIDETLNWG